jgi:hypothetical protein
MTGLGQRNQRFWEWEEEEEEEEVVVVVEGGLQGLQAGS